MWRPAEGTGLEHLRLKEHGQGPLADGLIIGTTDAGPFRVHYRILCDARWRVRELTVLSLMDEGEGARLSADGEGRWTTAGGEPALGLDGCIDVDISATPFTNTLPIQRLKLGPGESEDIRVAYVSVPTLEVNADPQRYTRLEQDESGATYRFESLDGGFTADLPMDADGLVLDYPGLFERTYSG